MLADRYGGALSILLGALALSETVRLYPRRDALFIGDHVLPGAVGIGLILLGLFLLIVKGKKFTVVFPERRLLIRMALMYAAVLGYWFFLKYLGYIISTFLIAVLLLKIMGYKSHVKTLIFSVVFTTVLYFIFVYWLKMPFPKGIFGI